MSLKIRVSDGDWGGAEPADVEAVARSAADCFGALDDVPRAIALEPTREEGDPPIALLAPNRDGEFVVRVSVRGPYWARLAYQFSHELCHVLADPRGWTVDRFAWLEEALCETASLFALRGMARAWATDPPYPNWRDYSVSFERYEADHVADPARTLPDGTPFTAWLAVRLPRLEADLSRRHDNTVVARELLPVFEADRAAWRAVRLLHVRPGSPGAGLSEYLDVWARACPGEERRAVESITVRLLGP